MHSQPHCAYGRKSRDGHANEIPDGSDITCTVKDADSLAFEVKTNHTKREKVSAHSQEENK